MELCVQLRHQPIAAGLALYSGLVTALTFGDRWAHHTFATSDFCLDAEKVHNAGYYGAIHCADHWVAWKDFSQWWSTFWGYLIPLPSMGAESHFLMLHMWANLVGWANTIVTLALIGSIGFLCLKIYATWVYGPKRC